jgi:predicted transcriptional regulator
VKAQPAKKAKVTVEKKKKKIDIARSIFSTNLKQERKTVIKKIMEKTGLSKVAAATYYQICKREG